MVQSVRRGKEASCHRFSVELLGRFSASVSMMTVRRRVRTRPNGRPPSSRQRASACAGACGRRSMTSSVATPAGSPTAVRKVTPASTAAHSPFRLGLVNAMRRGAEGGLAEEEEVVDKADQMGVLDILTFSKRLDVCRRHSLARRMNLAMPMPSPANRSAGRRYECRHAIPHAPLGSG